MSRRATLLYDGDCGFCRWSIAGVLRRDHHRILRPVPIQGAEGSRLLTGVPDAERLESWHLVLEDGRLFSGGAVFAPLLELLDRRMAARLLARAPQLTNSAYRSVAGRRGTLGRLVSRGAKRRADDLLREPAAPKSEPAPPAEPGPSPEWAPPPEPGPPGEPALPRVPAPVPVGRAPVAEPMPDHEPALTLEPTSSSDTSPGLQQRIEESTFGRGLLSSLIVATLVAIVAINLPASDLRRQLLRAGQPYLNALGADQNWALFAPDPRRVVIDVSATVTFDDGRTARWSFPHDGALIGTYRDYRWRKWEENLINPSNGSALWRPAALWAAGSEARPGHAATGVALVEQYASLAPPGTSPSVGPTQERVFYVLRLRAVGVPQ